MKAAVFLATGFEETEAIGVIDVLRRGTVDTVTVSITGDKAVTGAHNIPVIADVLFEDLDYKDFDAIVLPGGGPGSVALNNHEGVRRVVAEQYNKGKLIAAICAAPRVFGSLGLLYDKEACCYPGIEPELTGATIIDKPVVTDGNIITAQGPAFVFLFALEIINSLFPGCENGIEVADALLVYDDSDKY